MMNISLHNPIILLNIFLIFLIFIYKIINFDATRYLIEVFFDGNSISSIPSIGAGAGIEGFHEQSVI